MSELTPRLSLPYLMASQAQKHVTVNESLLRLDLLVQPTVEAFDAETPPTDPEDGQVWALGAAPTGAWSGQGWRLAAWFDGEWLFLEPRPGWRAAAGTDLRVWTGAGWEPPALPPLDGLPGIGIGASHDATNRLVSAAPATLLTHEGSDHRLKVNKAAPADTASLLFQTGFSGRAEFGTAGSDDFSVKVSPDGSTWHTALTVNRSTGAVHLPNAAQIAGALTGTAVVQSTTDTTAGRLLTPGWMGLGGPAVPDAAARALFGDANANTIVPLNGLFQVTGTPAWTGLPEGIGTPTGVLEQIVFRTALPRIHQVFWRQNAISGGTHQIWVRYHLHDNGWSPWFPLYDGNSAIGTVGQSGGKATGGLFQHGSSANGSFERRASGSMVCRRTDLSAANVSTAEGQVFRSASITWTFPSAFLSGSVPVVHVTGANEALIGFGIVSISNTAVTFRVKAATSIAGSVTLHAAAHGRWSDMT